MFFLDLYVFVVKKRLDILDIFYTLLPLQDQCAKGLKLVKYLQNIKSTSLLLTDLVVWAYFRVDIVSSKLVSAGDKQAIIIVRAFPPRES